MNYYRWLEEGYSSLDSHFHAGIILIVFPSLTNSPSSSLDYDEQVVASGYGGRFEQTFYLSLACFFIGHAPCYLYQLHDIFLALHDKITFAVALIVGYFVKRMPVTVQLHENRVLKVLAVIVALRHECNSTQFVVDAVVLVERLLLLY